MKDSRGSGQSPPSKPSPLRPVSHFYKSKVFEAPSQTPSFWGPVPQNIEEALKLSQQQTRLFKKKQVPLFTEERVEKLCKAIADLHRHHGLLTPHVQANLGRLVQELEVIEAGHQPALIGGPGFVINKLAAISRIAQLQGSVPMMFVGDHDHEQKELTVAHLPSPGPRGLIFSLSIPSSFRQSPLHVLPCPPKKWVEKLVQKIKSTYHELVARLPQKRKQSYTPFSDAVCQLLIDSYTHANNLSDWTLRIWMQLVNLTKDSGMLFQAFSAPGIRFLMLPAFEYLIRNDIYDTFITTINSSAKKIQELGYRPGIGIRPKTYVPFLIECPTTTCNRTRLEPTRNIKAKNSLIEISATCPKCQETHSLEVNASHPDLSPWKEYLSPRVDTRAFLIQSYTPIILHVGGAGETNYYAQVSPALKAVKGVVPTFFRYTRLFYGNPWTRFLAANLQKAELYSLETIKLNTYRSAVKTAHLEQQPEVVKSLFAACEKYIRSTAKQLAKSETQIENQRNNDISSLRDATDPEIRQQIQARIGLLTKQRQLLQTYQSQMLGRYAPERYGQEVSYAWIDMAMSLGPQLLFETLCAHYQRLTPSSATFYLEDNIEAP